jgi:hypothetical protein
MAESQQVHGRGSARENGQEAGRQGRQGIEPGPDVEGDHDNHGQSVAAWTAVGIVMFGALVMAIAVVIASKWLFVVGAVIAVLGGISGKVLAAMGFGKSGRPGH